MTLAVLCAGGAMARAQGGLAAAPPVDAAASRVIRAERVMGVAPAIDGKLDEAAWQQASMVSDFVQFTPESGAAATERTEVRVLVDEQSLYVAARMLDSDVRAIVAPLTRRDEDVYSDWFFLGIDGNRDRRAGFAFGVNPRGVKQDAYLYDDIQQDLGWDGVWDAAARIDAQGWTAEMRIPLSQLDLSSASLQAGRWGINFNRLLARRYEVSFWSPTPRDGAAVVSAFGEVQGPSALPSPRGLELVPYALGKLTRAAREPNNPLFDENQPGGAIGVDLKYNLSSNLVLTGTINPDFGQVEADPSVVNLTAFETFFPEKRPFFVEQSDIFGFSLGLVDTGTEEQLFYSRRIGRTPQRVPQLVNDNPSGFVAAPEATTIYGALKLSAELPGNWSLGFMDAITSAESARVVDASGVARNEPVEPLTNYFVARAIKDFRQGASAVGVIMAGTNRHIDADALDGMPESTYAGGVDGRHRFSGGRYELGARLLGSYVTGSSAAIEGIQTAPGHYYQRPDAEHLSLDPGATALSGYDAAASVRKIGGGHWRWALGAGARTPGFEVNDIGFQQSGDRIREVVTLGYDQFRPDALFRSWNVTLSQAAAWTFGGERVSTQTGALGTFELTSYWSGYLNLTQDLPALSTDVLRGGPAMVTPARSSGELSIQTDPRRASSGSIEVSGAWEPDTGGFTIGIRSSMTIRPMSQLALSLEPALSRQRNPWQYVDQPVSEDGVHFILGDLEQDTLSITARLSYTFSPRLSLQFYGQPFVSTGVYATYSEVVDPRAPTLAGRVQPFAEDATRYDEMNGTVGIDRDGDGVDDIIFADPDFSVIQFRSTAVMRWEYLPGSTLFLVWTQSRDYADTSGSLQWQVPDATNVLLAKLTYWWGS